MDLERDQTSRQSSIRSLSGSRPAAAGLHSPYHPSLRPNTRTIEEVRGDHGRSRFGKLASSTKRRRISAHRPPDAAGTRPGPAEQSSLTGARWSLTRTLTPRVRRFRKRAGAPVRFAGPRAPSIDGLPRFDPPMSPVRASRFNRSGERPLPDGRLAATSRRPAASRPSRS